MSADTTNAEQQLLALYDRVADAPDAIPRLRRLVLDLAVRGKLVEQDPDDEPASELLERVAAEKARLLQAGKIRKKTAKEPKMVAPPYELPTSWSWAPLGSIAYYDAGTKRESRSLDQSLWLLELEDVEKETGQLLNRLTVADRVPKSTKSEFQAGDILYGKLRPYLTKVLVADKPGYSTTEIVSIRPFIDLCSEYFALGLMRPDFVDYVTRLGQGTKMPRLRTEDAVVSPFPVPPIPEQHRIVAKVEGLMALLDRLAASRTIAESTRDRLTAASVSRLIAPDTTPESFPAHARFALDALPAITTRSDQVQSLRQAILNLAVHGKLVEQDPAEEPASESLRCLAVEKSKTGKGRNWSNGNKPVDDLAFKAPLGWEWTTIDQAAHRVTVGHVGPMKDKYVKEGIPFLRSQNVRPNAFRPEGLTFISPEFHQKLIKSALVPGDVVVVRSGNVGTACVIPEDLPVANCSDLVVIQKPQAAVPEFLCFYLNSLAMAHVEVGSVGVALTHFNTKSVATMPLPLPPLGEQQRIVAKVDELMALCDRLEAAITTADTTKQRLLKALLCKAMVGDINNKEAA